MIDQELTAEQFERQVARVSDGWCRWCPQRLQVVKHYEELMGACSCCGYQFQVSTHDYEELGPSVGLTTTGWPAGMGGNPANVGKCEHVDPLEEILRG